MATQPLATTSEQRGLVEPIAPGAGRRTSFLTSTIGTKLLIGITGLLLVLYLILHLVGNLLVFAGPGVFNSYSHFLITNPLIYPVEIGLFLIVVIHIYKAVTNWSSNRAARPVAYYNQQKRAFGYGWAGKPSRKSLASSTMIFSGLFTLLFLIIHVRQFRFGAEYATQVAGQTMHDLYRVEMENLANPFAALFYVVAVAVVCTHLWHGVSSAFTSLGIEHYRYTPVILKGGRILSGILAVGFIVIVLWVFATGGVR